MKSEKDKRGFTLIELLVVISIIGLMSSVVLASLNQARIKAQGSAFGQGVKQLQLALQLYIESQGSAPGEYYSDDYPEGVICEQNHENCYIPNDSYSFSSVLEPVISNGDISSLPQLPSVYGIDFNYNTNTVVANSDPNPPDPSLEYHYICGNQPYGKYTLEVYTSGFPPTNTLAFLNAMGLPKIGISRNGVIEWGVNAYCVTNY